MSGERRAGVESLRLELQGWLGGVGDGETGWSLE